MPNKDNGLVTYVDPGADQPVVELMTTKCCHCGGHFFLKPPKELLQIVTPFEAAALEQDGKTVRGFCPNCNGYVCGPQCAACVPEELYLENLEKGRPADYKPIRTFVPLGVPSG